MARAEISCTSSMRFLLALLALASCAGSSSAQDGAKREYSMFANMANYSQFVEDEDGNRVIREEGIVTYAKVSWQ